MTSPLFFLATAALMLPLLGQSAGPRVLDPVAGQTAEDLVTQALSQNGEILAGQQQVAAARGSVTQARLRANPSVAFTEVQQIAGGQNNFTVGGSLPLELYHRRERRTEVAQNSVRVAELDQAERQRQLRAEVETKFGEVLAAARNLQVVTDLLDLNRNALGLTQARADQGAIPPLDANLLRVEVSRIDAQRVDLEAKLDLAVLELKSLLGMKPEEDLRLKGSIESVPPAQDITIQTVLESRSDLLSVRAAEQLAGAKLRQAETEARPDASVLANYQRMDSSFDLNGLNSLGQPRPIQGIFHFLAVGVTLSLPFRNKNQGAIETAAALLEETRRRREYAGLIATRELAAALLARDKARESLRIFRDDVRSLAGQNLEVVRKTYELGRTQLLDVITEQRRFIDIEMGYTDALSRYYQATVRLRAVTGGR
jgi:outer membrane protein, heavy metal efflux system